MANDINNETTSNNELPPPSYNWVVYKIDENAVDRTLSGNAINNYPGPPLTDTYVYDDQNNPSVNHDNIISRNMRLYLFLNGIITIVFGCTSIGIEIYLITVHLIIYYYYGFWGGALLIALGLNVMILYSYHRGIYSFKFVYYFLWQSVLLGIVFGIGIVIMSTDKCSDSVMQNETDDHLCKSSNRILDGILLGTFAAAFLQSILNGIIFCILKKQF